MIRDEDLSKLERMFIDSFPDEAKELCDERGFKLTVITEPVEAEIGRRYDQPGHYEIDFKIPQTASKHG